MARCRSVKSEISLLLQVAFRSTVGEWTSVEPVVSVCNNPKLGDYQINNVMGVWSKIKDRQSTYKSQVALAQDVLQKIPATSLFEKTSVAGTGFINVSLSADSIAERLDALLRHGIDVFAPKLPVARAVVDFASPNIAKELHVGHIRSIVIGDSVARMLEFCNVHVLRRSHVGDWGTQFGMLLEHIFDSEAIVEDIRDLQRLYVESSERCKNDKDFKARALEGVVKLQRGEPKYREKWKTLCDISRRSYEEIYARLSILLEEKGESFYNPYIPHVITFLEEKGIVQEVEGAKAMLHHGHKNPLIVTKKDGGYTYASTDLAALWYRINVEKAEWIVYMTDIGQKEHFDMVFKTAKRAGWLPESGFPNAKHVGFGLVLGMDGRRVRGREGAIPLVTLLDDAKARSKKELIERGREGQLTAEDLDAAAEALGYGAIKFVTFIFASTNLAFGRYADLKNNRETNYVLNFDQMLDVKGNTAVYLLYAYARVCSIIRKSGRSIEEIKQAGALLLDHPHERALGLHLIRFPEAVEDSIARLMPSTICEYLYELSELFTQFYSSCKVNGSSHETSRLLLCEATRLIMGQCLNLLGITPLQKL